MHGFQLDFEVINNESEAAWGVFVYQNNQIHVYEFKRVDLK